MSRKVHSLSTPTEADPLMTTEETSAYLKASIVHLAQLRHRGKGPTNIKFSPKKVLYRKSSVDAWLTDRERTITS
jgi:predicted DNA-binding transcriptional regulator AlpA